MRQGLILRETDALGCVVLTGHLVAATDVEGATIKCEILPNLYV